MNPLNRKKLLEAQAYLIRRKVLYGFGAKAEGGSDPRNGHRWNRNSNGKLSTPITTIQNIDCSGLVRYLAYLASDGDTRWPDGSQAQRAWCRTNLEKCDYADTEKRDNVLRIGFMTPGINGVGSIGHVWFTFNGNTLESYGGHGVGSHKASVYARVHSGCFVVPSVAGVMGNPITETAPHDSIVVSVWANGHWTDKRIDTIEKDNVNSTPAQELLRLAKVDFTVSKWGDGSDNIRIIAK